MLFKEKLDRALAWEKEQKITPEDRHDDLAEEREEPDLAKEVEKGDMFAMMFAGCVTVFLPCFLVLLLIVGVGLLFFFH